MILGKWRKFEGDARTDCEIQDGFGMLRTVMGVLGLGLVWSLLEYGNGAWPNELARLN